MAITKLSDLVNPEVFADGIKSKIGNEIKLYPIAHVENFEGVAGGTISVPTMASIGIADKLTEGTAMTPATMSQTTEDIPVEEYGKAVEISDKALKNALGLDSMLSNAEMAIAQSINAKIDADLFAALAAIDGTDGTLLHSAAETAVNSTVIAQALEKFGEDQTEEKYLIVSPTELTNLRLDPSFQITDVSGNSVDVAGRIYTCDVMVSANVPAGVAYIYKPGATGLYLKKNIEVELDRDILKRSHVLAGAAQWASHLRVKDGAVKIQLGAEA